MNYIVLMEYLFKDYNYYCQMFKNLFIQLMVIKNFKNYLVLKILDLDFLMEHPLLKEHQFNNFQGIKTIDFIINFISIIIVIVKIKCYESIKVIN